MEFLLLRPLLTWWCICAIVHRPRRHLPQLQWTCCSLQHHLICICTSPTKHTLQATSPSQRKLMTFQTSPHAHLTIRAKVLKQHMLASKDSSGHSHNECGPLQCFPSKSTKSYLWNIQAHMHEITKHCLSTHVQLVHHEVWAYHNQRSRGKLAENDCHLASLQRFWAPRNVPLHRHLLCQHCTADVAEWLDRCLK